MLVRIDEFYFIISQDRRSISKFRTKYFKEDHYGRGYSNNKINFMESYTKYMGISQAIYKDDAYSE